MLFKPLFFVGRKVRVFEVGELVEVVDGVEGTIVAWWL